MTYQYPINYYSEEDENKYSKEDILNSFFENQLAPGQGEFVKTKNTLTGKEGLLVAGEVMGVNLETMYQEFLKTLTPEQQNLPNLLSMFEGWLKIKAKPVYDAIMAQGGLKAFLGNDGKPDVQVTGATSADPTKPQLGKQVATATPD